MRRCVRDRVEKIQSWQRSRQERTKHSRNVVPDEWASGKRDDGGKKGDKKDSKGSKSDWHGDKENGSNGNTSERKARAKPDIARVAESKENIGVNRPFKWTNSIDEEEDQCSPWESELEGEKPEELASLEVPDDEGEWCWPKRNRITR